MGHKYKVIWDNGHACDAFRETGDKILLFDTEKEAERFARDWKREMVASDTDPKEARRVYTWEVIEVTDGA